MKKGGYQIIDLENKPLTLSVGMVYEDIYDLIEGTRKPIYVSGVNIDGTEYHDTYVDFKVNGSNFEGLIYGYKIVIEDTNVVTISNNV